MSERRVTYCIDLSEEAWEALLVHGYEPWLPSAGSSADPEIKRWNGLGRAALPLRPHICQLDGIEVDGHEVSDLDPNANDCLHCDRDAHEFYETD